MSPVSSKWIGFVKLSNSFDVSRNKNPDWEIIWAYNIKPLCRLKYWAHLEICKIHMKSNGHRQKNCLLSDKTKARMKRGKGGNICWLSWVLNSIVQSKMLSSCDFHSLHWFDFSLICSHQCWNSFLLHLSTSLGKLVAYWSCYQLQLV